jgi:beta-carotene hydroxylase
MDAIANEFVRPVIPSEFYRRSLWGATGFILYALGMFLIPGALIYYILNTVESLLLQIALIVPLTVIGAFGGYLMGWLGHDGTHLSLHDNKYVSALMGSFFASMLVTYFEMGFAYEHWNHHRYCNKPQDPDIKVLSGLKTWWQRVFFTRLVYNLTYAKILFRVILGLPLDFKYKLPFKDRELRLLCLANLMFSLFWLSIYVALAIYDWRIAVFCILIPTFGGLIVSGSQSYIDHAGTPGDRWWENSRTRPSFLATALFFGGNYHIEHHLYPGVPAYRLGKVHRYLKEKGVFDRVPVLIEPGFWPIYRHLRADYRATHMEKGSFDPHHESIRGSYS